MSTQKKEQSLDVNETLAKSEAFVIKYKKQIITALVAAVIGVGGTLAYIYGYAKPREEKAGICNFNLGKTKEAIKYLEDFSAQDDATVSAQALYALGNCYATDKQFDKAVSTFKKAAEATSVPALCAEYLFQAGLILENQKKNNEALEVYQNIKKQYPTAPMCAQQEQNGVLLDAVIDKYIERLSK